MGQVLSLDALRSRRLEHKLRRRRVVLTNGCFDLLHVGHVRYLRAARDLGDCLIVGVNDDDSVRRLKGSSRPIVPAAERAEVLAALAAVDFVVLFSEDTAEALVSRLQPDVYVKGSDYGPGAKDLPEAQIVEAYGGRVAYVQLVDGRSTSDLVRRIVQPETLSRDPVARERAA